MENVLEISREDEEMVDAINSDYHDGLCKFVESEKEIGQLSKADVKYAVLDRGDGRIVLFFLVLGEEGIRKW
jgi:hypothetical protein